MLENSRLPAIEGAMERLPLTDLGRQILVLLRKISEHHQHDLLRMAETFAALPK